MQAQPLGRGPVEVKRRHRFAYIDAQLVPSVGLRDDAFAESFGDEATIGLLGDNKNEFVHGVGGNTLRSGAASVDPRWKNLTAHGFGLADELAACRPRPAWRALVHFHRTVGTSTFRSREQRDGALWFHFDKATIVYALKPTTITMPEGVTAVHDLEGHVLPVRPGEPLKIEGQPVYLSR